MPGDNQSLTNPFFSLLLEKIKGNDTTNGQPTEIQPYNHKELAIFFTILLFTLGAVLLIRKCCNNQRVGERLLQDENEISYLSQNNNPPGDILSIQHPAQSQSVLPRTLLPPPSGSSFWQAARPKGSQPPAVREGHLTNPKKG